MELKDEEWLKIYSHLEPFSRFFVSLWLTDVLLALLIHAYSVLLLCKV